MYNNGGLSASQTGIVPKDPKDDYEMTTRSGEKTCVESCCGTLLLLISFIFIIALFPLSLCVCIKMVQVRIKK